MSLTKRLKNINLNLKENLGLVPVYKNLFQQKTQFSRTILIKKIPLIKEELHQKCKNYRNTIATLMKKSKENYFTKYFETNIKNLKSTWKGIRSIISLKNSNSSSPNVINFNNELKSDPLKIANVFNNYFSSIGEKAPSKTRFSNKNYTDYLHGENFNSF